MVLRFEQLSHGVVKGLVKDLQLQRLIHFPDASQLHTHGSIKALTEVHLRTHPAAAMSPRPKPEATP